MENLLIFDIYGVQRKLGNMLTNHIEGKDFVIVVTIPKTKINKINKDFYHFRYNFILTHMPK